MSQPCYRIISIRPKRSPGYGLSGDIHWGSQTIIDWLDKNKPIAHTQFQHTWPLLSSGGWYQRLLHSSCIFYFNNLLLVNCVVVDYWVCTVNPFTDDVPISRSSIYRPTINFQLEIFPNAHLNRIMSAPKLPKLSSTTDVWGPQQRSLQSYDSVKSLMLLFQNSTS